MSNLCNRILVTRGMCQLKGCTYSTNSVGMQPIENNVRLVMAGKLQENTQT